MLKNNRNPDSVHFNKNETEIVFDNREDEFFVKNCLSLMV